GGAALGGGRQCPVHPVWGEGHGHPGGVPGLAVDGHPPVRRRGALRAGGGGRRAPPETRVNPPQPRGSRRGFSPLIGHNRRLSPACRRGPSPPPSRGGIDRRHPSPPGRRSEEAAGRKSGGLVVSGALFRSPARGGLPGNIWLA